MKENLSERVLNSRIGKQFQYVLSGIVYSSVSTDEELEFSSHKHIMQFFADTFHAEYDCTYTRKIYPNVQDRIASYLQGLPSCISIAFSYSDIIETGKSWGYCKSPKGEREFCDRWFKVLAFRIIQLCKRLDVEL